MEQNTPSLKFLIVDDDVSLAMLYKRMVESRGHKGFIEMKTPQLFDIIQKESINIALVDLLLPGSSGLDIVKSIKAKFPQTFCVLFSGYYNDTFLNYVAPDAANCVFAKPVTQEIIDDIVQKYLNQK